MGDGMKVVAITGGAQGIGRGVALRFAQAGYAVSFADVADDAGAELLQQLQASGAGALYAHADVAAEADVARWIARTVATLGCPDVLVNNAGIGRRAPFLDLSAADFDRVVAVNLRGTFLCTQAAARAMAARGQGGAVINIASTRAFMSEPGTEAYAASKGGIVALTHATAISLAPQRIRVNCVCPGWIEVRDWQYSGRAQAPAHSAADRDQHPAGRVGVPDDVAGACLYLADAGFVTGQTLVVDGGMTVKMIYAE
jgi:NAD(P)-dependent dehydrogenase (short-subunit alcohol dehydrogenase family)